MTTQTLRGADPFADLTRLGRIDARAIPRVLTRLTRLATRYPWRFAAAVVCALGAAVSNLVTPMLLGRAVDQANHLLAAGPGDAVRGALWWTAVALVAACAVRGALTGLPAGVPGREPCAPGRLRPAPRVLREAAAPELRLPCIRAT